MKIDIDINEILEKNKLMMEVFADILTSQKFHDLIADIVSTSKTSDDLPEFIFSGVGKNWYICEKSTKVFLSLGIQARALDCVHAIHGDLGMLASGKKKVLFFISKSGTSDELLKLARVVKYLRGIGHLTNIKVVGLFLNTDQTGREDLYDVIITPSKKYDGALYPEFDKRDIVPSLTINTIQSILDLLGSLIYEQYPDLVERYKYNHLAGANGIRLGVGDLFKSI